MNAISTRYGAGFAETAPHPHAGGIADPLARNARGADSLGSNVLGLGLQLSRASAMALTRLQLALCTGERRQALEAIDRLHALDSQLERLVERLEIDPADEADWRALSTHLTDQKLALAFEKLALASGISGPDLASASPLRREDIVPPAVQHQDGPHDDWPHDDEPPLVDWHAFPAAQPAEWNPFANRTFTVAIGVVLALVVTALLAAAAVMMTGF